MGGVNILQCYCNTIISVLTFSNTGVQRRDDDITDGNQTITAVEEAFKRTVMDLF